MVEPVRLSPAQQRALNWLPKDGSWKIAEKGIGRALVAFQVCEGIGSVEADGGPFGPRKGFAVRWRLTEAGVAKFCANRGDRG